MTTGTVVAYGLLVTAHVLDRRWQSPLLITMLTLAVVLGVVST